MTESRIAECEPAASLSSQGEQVLRRWIDHFRNVGNVHLADHMEEALNELCRLRSRDRRTLTVIREGVKVLGPYTVGTVHPSLVMLARSLRAVAGEGMS